MQNYRFFWHLHYKPPYELVYLTKIISMDTKPLKYSCPKCNNKTYKIGQMRATGGFWSKIFDIQTEKYASVTCNKCSYTEFYKASTKSLSNIFDFFTN